MFVLIFFYWHLNFYIEIVIRIISNRTWFQLLLGDTFIQIAEYMIIKWANARNINITY